MPIFRMTANRLIKRLRWIMVGVILLDTTNTLLGQPKAFWSNPAHAIERNQLVRPILTRGVEAFALGTLAYVVAMFLIVSLVPRRLALAVLLSVILGHYLGACTWWLYRWGFGMQWPISYAILLSAALVLCGIGGQEADS